MTTKWHKYRIRYTLGSEQHLNATRYAKTFEEVKKEYRLLQKHSSNPSPPERFFESRNTWIVVPGFN